MATGKKNWKQYQAELQKELLMDKVSDTFKESPDNWQSNLQEIGFTWVDDSEDELAEEKKAKPENENQEFLVAYFDEHIKFNEKLIDVLLIESELDEPNYPLFRKYFKAGNQQLLELLLSGISILPTNQALLSGLSYFHEYRKILPQLINAYMAACDKEENSEQFKLLCIDFISETTADGYEAMTDLKVHFKHNKMKNTVLTELNTSSDYACDEVIRF